MPSKTVPALRERSLALNAPVRPRPPLIVERVPIGAIKAYAGSPRVHSRKQREKLSRSIARFGHVAPLLIDGEGVLVDGHAALEVLRERGERDVSCIRLAGYTPGEVKALRLALNRIPAEATFDPAKLKLEFEAILELDVSLDLTGFDQVEFDMAFAIDEPSSAGVEDAPPEVDTNGLAVTRLGDLWRLGRHRLLCGDAQDHAVMVRLMMGHRAQVMFTDPPYNVAIKGFVSGGKHQREFPMASGEMSREAFTAFLLAFLQTAVGVLEDGAVTYVCMDWRHSIELLAAIEGAGLKLLNCCVWAKTNAGQGSFYRSQHEFVWVAKYGEAPHRNHFELGQHGRSRSNLWTYRGMTAVGKDRDALLSVHPTCKPVLLVADAIKDVSDRGGIVLDPFMGSGTTLIAANRTGRLARGTELDPLYCDAIIARFEAETGEEAVLDATGETFAERCAALVKEGAR